MLQTATNGSDQADKARYSSLGLTSNCNGNKAMNTKVIILSSFFLFISFESSRIQSNVTFGEACLICVIVRLITLAFVKSQIEPLCTGQCRDEGTKFAERSGACNDHPLSLPFRPVSQLGKLSNVFRISSVPVKMSCPQNPEMTQHRSSVSFTSRFHLGPSRPGLL